ncbi:LysR substrate-binding domain-containing protein [Schlegelella sp. S2-27]|uniref:LysR substrate-binding domain-containing protein n=1 Tax=Caldimonas mangrovi TaxID=2944811 RepID=A0ABT0YKR8_9BURK|nr:LysR substrate-binding domain-containing protein [Caldimonas mangrovi]MCM5679327.1 LysR substrate-binding domain-containing protein [Caldimonas mangrovi]
MNQNIRQRPLTVGPLRAFEAVARHLNFRQAAEELHLTQSAISRQIQGLEEDVGAPLFLRGTRHVELTGAGAALLRAAAPLLDRLDATVRQIRQARGRRTVSVTTFASFASLWLIPRLEAFQREHPDLDIRVSANDAMVDVDGGEVDLALRYCTPEQAPPGAVRLFGEVLTAVASRWLIEAGASGNGKPLQCPEDLAQHALLEEDDGHPGHGVLGWRYWLTSHGLKDFQPQRWVYFNYTYQQVQAALAGQGVALARLPMVAEALRAGELVEPFDPARYRAPREHAYWLVAAPAARQRDEVAQFCSWVEQQAQLTRQAIGEVPQVEDTLGEWD